MKTFGSCQNGSIRRQRFLAEHVKRCTGNPLFAQAFDQRCVVDGVAAPDIDEICGRLHGREHCLSNRADVVRSARKHVDEVIGFRRHLRQLVDVNDGIEPGDLARRPRYADDPHPKCFQQPGGRGAANADAGDHRRSFPPAAATAGAPSDARADWRRLLVTFRLTACMRNKTVSRIGGP